jgi:putative transposase|tara:strand:+ start:49905 stop:50072 length:168 start_codon:yes stop_codon:yes gene_type:complete
LYAAGHGSSSDLLPDFSTTPNLVESVSEQETAVKKRFTEEQTLDFLKQAEAGVPV